MRSRRARVILAAAALGMASCRSGPRPLSVGQDPCEFCRMVISDDRFGGELVLNTGRVRTFDSIECLASYLSSGADSAQVTDTLVSDFENRRLIPADQAIFLEGANLPSPMGRNVVAFSATSDTTSLRARHGGRVVTWAEVRAGATAPHEARHQHSSEPVPVITRRIGSVSAALAAAQPGDTIRVPAGVYAEPTLVIDKAVTLLADSGAVLDGSGTHTVMEVQADDVTVRGFTIRNTGSSQLEERAAIKVSNANRCVLAGNRIENTSFGIYLERTVDCLVRDNELRGAGRSQSESGNGIHVWSSEKVMIIGNDVQGHRDGIYFEFVRDGRITDNRSGNSARYGMHFMFSDDCRYERNRYHDNGNGVAVMYSKRITMRGNTFERSVGSAAYGLLLKDINDSDIEGNRFAGNSTALHLEGSNRNRIDSNAFEHNGLAIRLLANAQDNRFIGNLFAGNAFDVGTNSRTGTSTFSGNWWDRYRGYDLDRNGVGDVPFAPVRLFALIVEQSPAALVLLRSVFVDLLDLAERVMPALTPAALQDTAPLMRPPARS